ncbi:MAG: glycogen synthase, partial [bacterium]|nr:glycogen synthase [bacterium]
NKLKLDGWVKNWQLLRALFDEQESALIAHKLEHLSARNVVYCSFESRFARSGGLAAVTQRVLPYLGRLKGTQKVILVTPFYPYIIDESKLKHTGTTVPIPFRGETVAVEILKYSHETGTGVIDEYYLKAEGFFDARNRIKDPYLYHKKDPELNDETIKENALFFSIAVPRVAGTLGLREDILFHLQEWQTTLIALTAKTAMLEGTLKSCGTVQTMHNPFDAFISSEDLETILDDRHFRRYLGLGVKGHTAYQLGLQLVDGPITTVSKNFALEFTTDMFQAHHFAPHLQDIFNVNGVHGVNNGMFTDFPKEFSFKKPGSISTGRIKNIKLKKRKDLLEVLLGYHPEGRMGKLTYRGEPITGLPDNIPILVMNGRLDPVQKGFDIFLRAIEKFELDEIKVVLAPMPVRDSDLDYFYKVAYRCAGNLTIFPIRMAQGYHELQTGSTFGIMPSIYEPFGAAVEYMVNGTVTIARATGGLIDQIDDGSNGFLYKESSETYNSENIKAFTREADNVEARQDNPWVLGMVDQLHATIKKASDLYSKQPDAYYRMISNGLKKAASFNWDVSAKNYLSVYRKVSDIF